MQQNRRIRQDRYQYERYKARLGEDAPKNFSAFRRIKGAGEERWGILEAQYKGMGYYEKVIKNEPEITKVVLGVAKQVDMEPAGLKYRIKSKDSFLRKIRANFNPDGNTYEIRDIIRYTYTAEPTVLAEKTNQSIDALSVKGYNTIEVKNSWLDDTNPYKGINTNIVAPNGQVFEMQYHTPESFELKNGKLHELYEKSRLIKNKKSPEYLELQNKMFALSEELSCPARIEEVINK